ncbi:cysteine-rich CWC family protein [Ramlibacter sp.]|uniref:cysteine-rich CWC family protein n=1 Tax=Ramlibacter sp. TaxID=1917967 RepID=UPI002FC71C97
MHCHPVDPMLCPLCGQANRCAHELEKASGRPQPPCWCTGVDFAPELLARVPAEATARACICPACAAGSAR